MLGQGTINGWGDVNRVERQDRQTDRAKLKAGARRMKAVV